MQQNWQKIYLDHSPKLLGICRRYITDLQTAEDLLQDSFITAIQKNHQLKDEKALFSWLKKIVVNNALQHLRKNSKELFVSTELSEIPESIVEMNNTSEEKHILAYNFTREELLASIDSLPFHHKSVFNLYFIENQSHAQISGLLGISINTSKSHLLRAKKSIQINLTENVISKKTPQNSKKLTQLIVFFGFSGLLWAQTFRSKFSEFAISPSQNFVIPHDLKINHFQTASSNLNFKKKLIISITFIIIIVLIFLNTTLNSFQFNSLKTKNPTKQTKTNLTIVENPPQDYPIQKDKTIKKNNNLKIDYEKNSIPEKISDPDEKMILEKNKSKPALKDSAQQKKKIVIVKKILQRDTVFIER